MHRLALRLVAALVGAAAPVALLALAVRPAEATFPGKNGKLAYSAGLRTSAGDIPLDLYVMPAGGGKAVKLVDGGHGGSWSPDGTRIAYVTGEYTTEVYVLDVATGTSTQVTKNAYNEGGPEWSPDGKRLVFIRRVGPMDTPYRIVTSSVNGGDERTVLQRAREPVWSPDGKRIAFVGEDWPQVFLVAIDGSGARRLTSGFLWAVNPEWSPDGSELAFAALASSSTTPQIYVIGADGSGVRQVTSSSGEKGAPAWSPDGTELAFTNTEHHGIFVVDAGGGAERRLTPKGSKLWYYDLSWQPRPGALPTGTGPTAPKPTPTTSTTTTTATGPKGGGTGPHGCTIMAAKQGKELRDHRGVYTYTLGTAGADIICGTEGRDTIGAMAGDDVVYAAGGDDIIHDFGGDDTVYGGAGNDSMGGLRTRSGNDHFYGNAGNDTFGAKDGEKDVIDGGPGTDCAAFDRGLDVLESVEQYYEYKTSYTQAHTCLPLR